MEKRTKRKVAALTLGSFFLLSMVSGCGAKDTTEQETVDPGVPIEVETAEIQDFDKVVTLGGLTAAENTVSVIAKVSGMEQIQSVHVKVGDKVTEGQVLAQLDNETTQINVDNAQLAVNNAENSIATAQLAYDNAVKSYNNALELFNVGAVSQTDLDQLKLARDNAESQLNAAQIGVANARNTLQTAQLALDYATVTAPISGTITMVNANEGSYASASAPMFEIANVDTLEVSTGINEQNVSKIKVGQEVLLKINSVSDQWFSGNITEIGKVMNTQTKNYPITISLHNQDDALVAGMYAEVEVIVDHADDVLVIPVDAIVYKDAQPIVYTAQADGTVKETKVTLGLNDGDQYVVTEGLKAGDQIVVKGNSTLVDGAKVTVVTLDGVAQELDLKTADDSEQSGDEAAAANAGSEQSSDEETTTDAADSADAAEKTE